MISRALGWREAAVGFGLIFIYLSHYYAMVLAVPDSDLLTRYSKVLAGAAAAPDQYRLLVPFTAREITAVTGSALRDVVFAIDAGSLVGGALILVWLLRRQGVALRVLVGLLYVMAFAVTALMYPRAETFPGFLGATAVLAAYVAGGRRGAAFGILGAVLLAGCRPEMAAAAALPFLIRWWRDRRAVDLLCAFGLVVIGAAGAILPTLAYPLATYEVEVVQIVHNLNPKRLIIPLCAFAPVLLVLTRERFRRWLPLLAWIAAVVVLTFAVGRLNEARIFVPLTGVLAYVLVNLWVPSPTPAVPVTRPFPAPTEPPTAYSPR